MRRVLLACGLLALAASAHANDNITISGALGQQNFDDLSTDLSAVTSYKQVEGSSSLGIAGFDVGLNVGDTQVDHKTAWANATGSNVSNVPFWNLSVSKGLPFGFDIGGEYSALPGSNVKLYGLESRYAILDGGVAEPAVSLRVAYNHITGVDNLSYNTKSVDVSVSKGFGPITPYEGVGEVWLSSTPDASTGLTSFSQSNSDFFAGLTFELGIHMALQYDHLAGNSTYTFKFGFGF